MEMLRIRGGRPLEGKVQIFGAKNSFSKLMVASLLTEQPITLSNCPMTVERALTQELLEQVGVKVSVSHNRSLTINARTLSHHIVNKLSRKNRIPILALAPLLHRRGSAEVPYVGGDAIGARPVNYHLKILERMGARVATTPHSYTASAKKLHGATFRLPYPSVGATETGILAGVLAKGMTVIKNAALEPEIIDLISMLQKMGALIELGTNRVISIEGVEELHGGEHRVMPDRLEAAAFAVLAVATKGNILVLDARQDHLLTFLNALRRVGGEYSVEKNGIRFYRSGALKPLALETSPHPGFATDWQQPFAVLLMIARGISTIHETVYEDRFGYIKDFIAMGAHITVYNRCIGKRCRFAKKKYPHSIKIHGSTVPHGADITVPDIRAGLAHVVAALVAKGESHIYGVEHLDRGYEKIEERLTSVGADIKRL